MTTRAMLPSGLRSPPYPRSKRGSASLLSSCIRPSTRGEQGSAETLPGKAAWQGSEAGFGCFRIKRRWNCGLPVDRVTMGEKRPLTSSRNAAGGNAMTIAGSTVEGLSELEHRAQLRRAVASTVGHDDRVVRLLYLQHGDRPRFPEALFPDLRPARRHVAGLRHLCRGLCRAARRSGDLRSLRRPYRAQGGADRDSPA